MTQGGNVGVIVGVLVLVLKQFNLDLAPDELALVVTAIGVIISWIGRYRQGDLTVAGFRK